MRQEVFFRARRQKIFLLEGGVKLIRHDISLDTLDFLMRQETGDFLIGGEAKTDKT